MSLTFRSGAAARRALATLVLLAAAPALAAPTAGPTHRDATGPAAPVGVFRIVLEEDRREAVPARIVVERRNGAVEAMLLIDQRVTPLRLLRADAGSLRAALATEDGAGELSVTVTDAGVTGTLTVKKRVWRVTGERSI